MKKKLLFILFLISLLISLCACTEKSGDDTTETGSSGSGKAELIVTSDYGKDNIYKGESDLQNSITVMELLKRDLEVKTAYGGSFINAINGLHSYNGTSGSGSEMKDWFFYANGILSSVGAGDYQLMEGDRIWLDHHIWSEASFTPAVIGSYPQPFVNGFLGKNPGTLILTVEDLKEDGEALAKVLKTSGVKDISIETYEEKKLSGSDKIVIVIAPWGSLDEDGFLKGTRENREKTGLFLNLAKDTFITLNANGQEVSSFSADTGAVFAIASGLGDTSPVWVVTGTDISGTKRALELLLSDSDKISGKFAVLINDSGNIISLPDQRK